MSAATIHRPVIIEYPHDAAMRPIAGEVAQHTLQKAFDAIPDNTIIEVANSVCELLTEDIPMTDEQARTVFSEEGVNLTAAAQIPIVVAEIRRWISNAIEYACWEQRTPVRSSDVENYVEHIGGHPYAVVVTSDDDVHAGLRILHATRRGCVTCHPH
ncbi:MULTISPECIES: hypothetical protein [Rhodococcus]|uniref:hypothetical protein n=1 Tax=Rhodococcus TaxID=1827 RepID=UPI0007D991C8|nr:MULTISPECIES: hypothetical protein [Rhodococcus]WAL49751.1 hypothetical protein OQN32_27465 [Rhodococcus pyridinivorans]